MVESVHDDSRGILRPRAGLRHFSLERVEPGARTRPFIDRYWVADWSLPPEEAHRQEVLAHPVVNIVFETSGCSVHGVSRARTTRVIEGSGRAIGVMFRPGGFRPLLDVSMSALTGRSVPFEDCFGPRGADLADEVAASLARPDVSSAALATLIDEHLASVAPAVHDTSLTRAVELAASDPAVVRSDQLASMLGITSRQLQRRFADEVGVSPKWVLRRYRIYGAAERVAAGESVDWAEVATELGFSDQAHLTREFTAAFGQSPARYAASCREAVDVGP